MFTGLIRTQATLVKLEPLSSGARLQLRYSDAPLRVNIGDSVAVNGACLTVLEPDEQGFSADLSTETLACTTLGQLQPGDWLNLEPSMALGDKLDGHLVSGHVDGVGSVRSVSDAGDSTLVWFDAPDNLLPLIAGKGSITIDGISLTVNETDDLGFRVQLIPHTRQVTNFSKLDVDQAVNLEVDLIARYVARLTQFNTDSR